MRRWRVSSSKKRSTRSFMGSPGRSGAILALVLALPAALVGRLGELEVARSRPEVFARVAEARVHDEALELDAVLLGLLSLDQVDAVEIRRAVELAHEVGDRLVVEPEAADGGEAAALLELEE